MKHVSYSECPYAEDDSEELAPLEWHEYPCYHPSNYDHTCPLRNKDGKKEGCSLLER